MKSSSRGQVWAFIAVRAGERESRWHEAVEHRAPREILADLAKLEEEIQQGMKELEGMLK